MRPELSGEEVRTSRRIAEELGARGIPFVREGKGNIVGKITGTRTCDIYQNHSDNAAGACGISVSGIGNKTIAIRGDFDALPVKEETGLSFASLNDGVMPACRHDAHAAGVLDAVKMLKEHEVDFAGTVYVCFQMGEEIVEGAEEIIEYLESEGIVDRMVAYMSSG